MKKNILCNPIIKGFYPDPSICRRGEDYYLVTSSFVYFPGLPVFQSKDLVHWEQIGHAISRINQLDYKNCETSLGLYAPTIRYHNKRFYIINTFVSGGREACRDNFVIFADNPEGPWSDPIYIEQADGIDPTIYFDDDGSVWYVGNYISEEHLYEGHHGIYLCEMDSETFQLIGDRVILWDGKVTKSKWLEAPHLYKRDDYYYLMVAEGGTHAHHSVQIARSRSIRGPYELCPRNPIVTHRHLPSGKAIDLVGHGDLIQTQNNEWWMVLLGVRPYDKIHYNLGRETFLVPIKWEDDQWPIINNSTGLVQSKECLPDLPLLLPNQLLHSTKSNPFKHALCDEKLSYEWNTIHPNNDIYLLTKKGIKLFARADVINEICTPSFIGRRQQHHVFSCSTKISLSIDCSATESGLVLIQDHAYNYIFVVSVINQCNHIKLYKTENGIKTCIQQTSIPKIDALMLKTESNGLNYSFHYSTNGDTWIPLYEHADLTLLSSVTNKGFTGTYIGLYITSNKEITSDYVEFTEFQYQGDLVH